MADRPRRIQRKRTKGWRMPEGAVYVGRGSAFGNPYRVGLVACGCRSAGECACNAYRCETAAEAVERFRQIPRSATRLAVIRRALAGRDLACWCPPDRPCHADVLLELANGKAG